MDKFFKVGDKVKVINVFGGCRVGDILTVYEWSGDRGRWGKTDEEMRAIIKTPLGIYYVNSPDAKSNLQMYNPIIYKRKCVMF